ncbi:molybdate ABC transporter permease subunit [Paenibacillus flagellatus]|uniref:molybdate ABC transporter permease subunit n=1 Tax=Paenibacillus flagellatus TaxID=2211139 RepID=UPI001FE7BCBE|nr:molybdate ABC transporter permease subunit [Paenibacillus flagellatus]
MSWPAFLDPVVRSIQVALLASVLAFVAGVAAAKPMSRARFRGKALVETVAMLPLVLPPTVIGFVLLTVLGRRSWPGRLAEWLFDRPIVFSWQAAVIAAAVVAFPLVYQTAKVGFASIDPDLEAAGRSMGAGEWQLLRYVTLPLAGRALLAAYVLGFARAIGEFGATLMLAGNIPGKTQTLPTAIYIASETGNASLAWWWTGTIVAFSYALLLLVSRKN